MQESKSTPRWRWAILFVGVWTLVGLIFTTVSYAAAFNESGRRLSFSDAARFNLVAFYLWSVFSLFIFWFSRRFPVEFRPLKLRNVLFHVPALLFFAAAHQATHLGIHWSILPPLKRHAGSFAEYFRIYFGFGFYIDLIIASLIVIAAHALLYYQRFRAGELERSSLKTQLAEAQLRALKMQLHPHFLFNTLHSISSLVLEDPPRANAMIARLGDFLRLTLEHSDQQMVTLNEEIEFLRCYLEIEQVRFADRLRVDFEMEPTTLAAHVPHLILQPVVENAIQHAVAPRSAPGSINIVAKRSGTLLRLEVKDNGPGIETHDGSLKRQGLGLSNVDARLQRIYGEAFSFEMTNAPEGGLHVIIEMPWEMSGWASAGRKLDEDRKD